mmetsp:Transcript_67568/g.161294  ORF Transcript_67568/g.161294 Transcript_67568/m.161294 type:complete len:509 (-) Transcript_67568:1150-2676(-)
MDRVLPLVRPQVVVPPGAPRRDDNLPWHADHIRLHLEDSSDVRDRHEPQRRLRHDARVVRCRGDHVPRAPQRRVRRVVGGGHGGSAGDERDSRAYYALRCWRVRQRVDGGLGAVRDFLLLVPFPAQRRVVDLGHCDGLRIHLHGCGVGRVHFRGEHDRRARWRAGAPRTVLLIPPQGILPLVHHRHFRRHPRAGCRHGAVQVSRAAGAFRGVPRHPAAGDLRAAAEEEEALHDGGPGASHEGVRRRRRGARRACRDLAPYRLLRAALLARARAVREAHAHREPPGRLGRRAPAGQPSGVLAVPALFGVLRARRIRPLPTPAHQGKAVPGALRLDRILLLQQDGAAGAADGAHLISAHRHRYRRLRRLGSSADGHHHFRDHARGTPGSGEERRGWRGDDSEGCGADEEGAQRQRRQEKQEDLALAAPPDRAGCRVAPDHPQVLHGIRVPGVRLHPAEGGAASAGRARHPAYAAVLGGVLRVFAPDGAPDVQPLDHVQGPAAERQGNHHR